MFRTMGRNLRLCFRRKLIIIRTQAIVLGEFIRERGKMTGEQREALQITDQEAQYDASAKRLLAQKYVLAYLLVKTVKEFRGMNPKEIIPLIEGEPYVSVVPVDGGLTNREMKIHGSRIVGMNTEDTEKKEGMIRFDIIFYVRMKDGLSQIIVNVEAQKDEPYQYRILKMNMIFRWRRISERM